MNEKNVVGMILAGGLSRRMGEDKSQKKILGKSLIELVIRRSKKQVQTLIINSNDLNESQLKSHVKAIIKDCLPGNLGPLVGILSGIIWTKRNTKSKWMVSFPVDSPFFPENLVFKFLEISKGYDIILAEGGGRVHPVFSMWKVNLEIEKQLYDFLKNDQRKIDNFTKKFKTRVVNFPDIGYDPFFNINTPNDVEIAKKIYRNNLK